MGDNTANGSKAAYVTAPPPTHTNLTFVPHSCGTNAAASRRYYLGEQPGQTRSLSKKYSLGPQGTDKQQILQRSAPENNEPTAFSREPLNEECTSVTVTRLSAPVLLTGSDSSGQRAGVSSKSVIHQLLKLRSFPPAYGYAL